MILVALMIVPAISQAQPSKKWLRVGLVCSSTAEAYDTAATLWAVAKHEGHSRELNPLMRPFVHSPWQMVAVKAASVTLLSTLAIKSHKYKPWVAYAMLFGNCAGKMWLGVSAERVGRRPRSR